MIRTALAGLALAVCASAAPPTNCSETPVQWIVNNLTLDGVSSSLISNDGTPAYVNGQSGVSAVIDCTPNAHISFNTSQRSISYHFTSPLYTDQYTPAGLTGSAVNFSSIIRNILYQHNASIEYTFTTRLDSFSSQFGPFRMLNLSSQAVAPGSGGDDVSNIPYADALVYVHHCPKSNLASGGCPALAHETYYVYPDPTVNGTSTSTGLPIAQVGAMVLTVGNGRNAQTVNGGEFSMPFYFAISLLN